MQQRTSRKSHSGVVVSNKMDNTVVVRVDTTGRHPKYDKIIKRGRKFYAHDDSNQLAIGDKVTITECRPLSKTKCWRVVAS